MRFWLLGLLLVPHMLQAETLTCPIGGERFKAVVIPECAPDSRLTMTLTPAAGCAPVLQQCPQNFLPLYKDFSEADLALLEDFIISETYDSAVDRSPYYLAYLIERYIGEDNPALPIALLYEGLWRDPENTFTDAVYLEDFLFEVPSEIQRVSLGNRPFLQSIAAFVMLKARRPKEAMAMLESAVPTGKPEPLLTAYQAAIRACMADSASAFCDPRSLILPE